MKKVFLRKLGAFVFLTQFLVAYPALGSEGTIQITGQGSAEAKPEFTTIRVAVTSICYDSSRAAKDANAVLANKLVSIYKEYVRSEKDKVTTTGGQTIRQTEYVPEEEETAKTKVLCLRKWRAVNGVTLQTSDLAAIPEIQDKVLAAIDKMEEVDPTKTAQTYAELMQPNFYVHDESEAKLKKAAHGYAWDDAKDQLEAFKAKCAFKNMRLKTIEEPSFSRFPKEEQMRLGEAPTSTPVLPDFIRITAIWKFVWTFEQSEACLL